MLRLGDNNNLTLTDNDRELLRMIALGYTNRQMSLRLGKSKGAIQAILHRMFEHFWVNSRAELLTVLRGRI
jgi:DNA-binding CsgD family transcriptional regulator